MLICSRHLLVGVLSGLSLLGAGCSSGGRPQTDTEKNLQALTVLYGKYMPRHRGVGPASEAEFKKFIQSLAASEVEALGVNPADLDKLFVSPRDGQPYQFAWKVQGTPGPDGKGPLIIWEKTGVGGKRMAGNTVGGIEELDEAAFAKRVGPAGKS